MKKTHSIFIPPSPYIEAHAAQMDVHALFSEYSFAHDIDLMFVISVIRRAVAVLDIENRMSLTKEEFNVAFSKQLSLMEFLLRESLFLQVGQSFTPTDSLLSYVNRQHEFTDSSDSEAGSADDSSDDSVQFRPGR